MKTIETIATPVQIHISVGNAKLGKVPNFSLVPGRTCSAEACKTCLKEGCYAMKSYRVYSSVKKAWDDNTAAAVENLPALETELNRYFAGMNAPRYFRLHVGGDFVSREYAEMWARVMKKAPTQISSHLQSSSTTSTACSSRRMRLLSFLPGPVAKFLPTCAACTASHGWTTAPTAAFLRMRSRAPATVNIAAHVGALQRSNLTFVLQSTNPHGSPARSRTPGRGVAQSHQPPNSHTADQSQKRGVLL